MTKTTFQLGMGQILVEGGQVSRNIARAVRMIRQAAARNCRLVVLPECLDIGWADPAAAKLAQPIPGPTSEELCQAARQAGIHVVAGLTERSGERIYNAALLIAPDGTILRKHRKINTLVDVEGIYATGDSLAVVETGLGTVGLTICADNFPDSLVLGHALARMGAQLILSPSAWAVAADHDNDRDPYGQLWQGAYTTLARLYDITVVGVSNVGRVRGGPWQGRKCIGCSLAVGPGGRVLAQGPYGEGAEQLVVVTVEILPRLGRGTEIAPLLAGKGYEGP